MSANGRVITGFSKPIYSVHATGTRTQAPLARGVDVTIAVESSDSIDFYADNGKAESIGGHFTKGTLTLNVDGLLDTARNAIYGMTAPTSPDTWQSYKTTDTIPYVAIGFIVRYVSDGVTSYVPFILPKCQFKPNGDSAKTQSENIEFQTQSLEATIYENADNVWKLVGTDAYSTESAALTALETKIIA